METATGVRSRDHRLKEVLCDFYGRDTVVKVKCVDKMPDPEEYVDRLGIKGKARVMTLEQIRKTPMK